MRPHVFQASRFSRRVLPRLVVMARLEWLAVYAMSEPSSKPHVIYFESDMPKEVS